MKYEDLEDTFYVVEATDYEQLALWRVHAQPGRVSWEQDGMGLGRQVGEFGGMPVFVTLVRNKIEGRWVVFYEATSRVVDHQMVREWIDEHVLVHCPRTDGRTNHCNAMNFGHCLTALRRAKEG